MPPGRSTISTCRSACWRASRLPARITPSGWNRSGHSGPQVAAKLAELKERFEKESALVNRVREIRGQLEEGTGEQEPLRAELEKLNAEVGGAARRNADDARLGGRADRGAK